MPTCPPRRRNAAVPLIAASLAALLLSIPSPARADADGIQASLPGWQNVTAVLARLRRQAAFRHDWKMLATRFPAPADQHFIVIDIARQRLDLYAGGQLKKTGRSQPPSLALGKMPP